MNATTAQTTDNALFPDDELPAAEPFADDPMATMQAADEDYNNLLAAQGDVAAIQAASGVEDAGAAAEEAPPEIPEDEIDYLTEAALVAKDGFVIVDRDGVDWFLEKKMMNQVEIEALNFKATKLIAAIRENTDIQIAPYQREIRSLDWRFGKQVAEVSRRLITQLKKGKTIGFTYGSAALKSHKEGIEVIDDKAAVEYVKAKDQGDCYRTKYELAVTSFKLWAMQQLAEIHVEVLQRQGGDLDAADFARDQMLQLEFPFFAVKPAGDDLTIKVGA